MGGNETQFGKRIDPDGNILTDKNHEDWSEEEDSLTASLLGSSARGGGSSSPSRNRHNVA